MGSSRSGSSSVPSKLADPGVVVAIESPDTAFVAMLTQGLVAHGVRIVGEGESIDGHMMKVRVIDSSARTATDVLASPQSDVVTLETCDPSLTDLTSRVSFKKPMGMEALVAAIHVACRDATIIKALGIRLRNVTDALKLDQSISMVAGVLVERFHLTPIEARERLRRLARTQRTKLQTLAEEILRSVHSSNELLRRVADVTPNAAEGDSSRTD